MDYSQCSVIRISIFLFENVLWVREIRTAADKLLIDFYNEIP